MTWVKKKLGLGDHMHCCKKRFFGTKIYFFCILAIPTSSRFSVHAISACTCVLYAWKYFCFVNAGVTAFEFWGRIHRTQQYYRYNVINAALLCLLLCCGAGRSGYTPLFDAVFVFILLQNLMYTSRWSSIEMYKRLTSLSDTIINHGEHQ